MIVMEKEYKVCQSCGMPLKEDKDRGTEKDLSLSHKYCQFCYKNGEFTYPNVTLEEFQIMNQQKMKEAGVNPILRWLSKFQLPGLERWRSSENNS
jgi:hypothetical protein